MLLNKNEIIRVAESYLRDAGISAEDKAAIVQDVISDAEVAVMEIVRRRVKEAQSQL